MHISLERVQASLLGVRIGDALGMPVETMSPEEIQLATNGMGITTFVDAIQKRLKVQSEFKAGESTDDWQLTRVVAESLIASDGYNQEDMARRHVQAAAETTAGWGGTTQGSTEELRRCFANQPGGRNPWTVAEAKPGLGAGNGVAMKVAPLALAIYLREQVLGTSFDASTAFATAKYTELLWRLTHSHVDALHTAYAIAMAMQWCQVRPITNHAEAREFLHWLQEDWRCIHPPSNWGDYTPTLERLRWVEARLGQPNQLAEGLAPGWLAIDSVPYALGIFLSYPTDGRTALLTCVNSGIDTDTTAAICGSLIGANCGFAGFPEEWRNFRPDFQEAIDLGTQLFEVFAQRAKVSPHA
ncbi:MAG: ADP-ribosylglycohydrolase family protein [Patescibacteria group bacterium]